MSGEIPRVFSIPAGTPFLDTLAKAIVGGQLLPGWPEAGHAFSLSDATILLPTRRAARSLLDLIETAAGEQTLLLPKIMPFGSLDDAEDRLIIERGIEAFVGAAETPPEIDPVRRRLVLTKLVLAWAQRIEDTLSDDSTRHLLSPRIAEGVLGDPGGFVVAKSVRDGLQLADALGQLIDTLVIHGKTWEDVHALAPLDLADEYWSISKDFLAIASEAWPTFCSSQGVMDAAERRHHIILAEAERLRQELPNAPFIAAGSTGSMPATAKLISAIARLPRGAVVLPGLDQSLDDFSWNMLVDKDGKIKHPSHPQAQMAHLLHVIGLSRADVISLGQSTPELQTRSLFLSEVMRPPEATELWRSRPERLSDVSLGLALDQVSVVEAEQEYEEALAISVALRGVLETPDKIAALITPDRSLAERVGSELQRWGIRVEDSAGIPLQRSSAGSLATLVAEAVASQFSPFSVLALLNHRGAALGMEQDLFDRGKRAIDIGLLRTPLTGSGLEGMYSSLALAAARSADRKSPRPLRLLDSLDWAAAYAVLARLMEIYRVIQAMHHRDVLAIMAAHEEAVRQVAARLDNPDAFDRLDGAEAVAGLFDSAISSDDCGIEGNFRSYTGFFEQLMAGVTISRFSKPHPRIKIWGLLEARLMPADLIILAGLDETVWPPETRTDPFLNRPWRDELNLPAPERRVGQTAHDFVEAMGTKEVVITRAIKRSGSPTVPSRFLQRMRAVAGETLFGPVLTRGHALVALSRTLDQAAPVPPLGQPRPVPPPELLPSRLSVTEIETLRRDPYSIYAKHVLKLDPLEAVGKSIGASERGTMFHEAFARFVENWPVTQPAEPLEELLAIGREVFAAVADLPEFQAFWWPSFEDSARWFVGWDLQRRKGIAGPFAVERHGALTIPLPRGGEFILSGQADRIELRPGGGFSIIDFKTGKTPSVLQVKAGFSPQLTLEAAMVKRNAFQGLSGGRTEALLYVKLGGKNGGEERPIRDTRNPFDPDELAEIHYIELVRLVDEHWNACRCFSSRPHPEFLKDYARYDHLARVREWSLTGGSTDEVGEE